MRRKAGRYADAGGAVVEFGKEGVEVGVLKRERERNERVAGGNELGDKTSVGVAELSAGMHELDVLQHDGPMFD